MWSLPFRLNLPFSCQTVKFQESGQKHERCLEACEVALHHCSPLQGELQFQATCWIWRAENSNCQGADPERGKLRLFLQSLCSEPPLRPTCPIAFFHRRQTLKKPCICSLVIYHVILLSPGISMLLPSQLVSLLRSQDPPCLKAFPCFNPICRTQ